MKNLGLIGGNITTVGEQKRIQVFEPEEELKFGWLPHYHCCRTERGTNCSDGLDWVSAGDIAKLSMFA